jgi:hypothetical protein
MQKAGRRAIGARIIHIEYRIDRINPVSKLLRKRSILRQD